MFCFSVCLLNNVRIGCVCCLYVTLHRQHHLRGAMSNAVLPAGRNVSKGNNVMVWSSLSLSSLGYHSIRCSVYTSHQHSSYHLALYRWPVKYYTCMLCWGLVHSVQCTCLEPQGFSINFPKTKNFYRNRSA